MSFIQKPEMAPALLLKTGYTQSCSAFKDYEEQITAYFSNRSCNTGFQWDTPKLEKRFKNACKQAERFISLQEKV
ncbi:hypothetical protein [Agriterribacter sp.]|uniref:hypothetical protein n=1 Tax=Agriterribacter sp. TaxID=2821509 RepID=UPI002CAE2514|nr:hypothetical protein [Agriterribacter sp.]HRO47556.1 hypothetical protein [Agriterribacter sp.]